jgi:hypothetical protein
MPWARIDDRANSDAKLLALSDSAYRLWVGALIFCQANLTDGFIPTHAIETFGVRAKNKAPLVRELTASVLGKRALWQSVEGGWQFNDFLDWNDSREVVLAQRAKGKSRVDRFRAKLNGHGNAERNAARNALQTANELRSFAASTTTTKDQNQEPREDAPRSHRQLRMELRTMVEMRRHLRAACHRLIESDRQYQHDSPHQRTNLSDELKTIAARDLRVVDYDSREIEKVIDAVIGQRARRLA